MNKFYLVFSVLVLVNSGLFAQEAYLDPSLGLSFNTFETETTSEKFTAIRAGLGIHNVVAKRVGFYTALEYSPSLVRSVRGTLGTNIRISNLISVFGGWGLIDEGVIGNSLKNQNLRKEAGVELSLMKDKLNVDLGLSSTGPVFTVGYKIPVILHVGKKTVNNKLEAEKKQADDLVNALKELDDVKVNSAKELAEAQRRLADAELALKNSEAARMVAENAAREAMDSKKNSIENRTVSRSRAIDIVKEAASKSKANYSGALALLNGGEMVTFKYKSSDLSRSYSAKLEQLKAFLDQSPEYSLLISGHACDLGTDEANQILSEARADAARKFLISKGISGDRVITKGMGERAPIAPNDREGNRKKNRRVDFTLLTN